MVAVLPFYPLGERTIAPVQRQPFIALPRVDDLVGNFGTRCRTLEAIARLIVKILEHFYASLGRAPERAVLNAESAISGRLAS